MRVSHRRSGLTLPLREGLVASPSPCPQRPIVESLLSLQRDEASVGRAHRRCRACGLCPAALEQEAPDPDTDLEAGECALDGIAKFDEPAFDRGLNMRSFSQCCNALRYVAKQLNGALEVVCVGSPPLFRG